MHRVGEEDPCRLEHTDGWLRGLFIAVQSPVVAARNVGRPVVLPAGDENAALDVLLLLQLRHGWWWP